MIDQPECRTPGKAREEQLPCHFHLFLYLTTLHHDEQKDIAPRISLFCIADIRRTEEVEFQTSLPYQFCNPE